MILVGGNLGAQCTRLSLGFRRLGGREVSTRLDTSCWLNTDIDFEGRAANCLLHGIRTSPSLPITRDGTFNFLPSRLPGQRGPEQTVHTDVFLEDEAEAGTGGAKQKLSEWQVANGCDWNSD
jgi:hypothetical protein